MKISWGILAPKPQRCWDQLEVVILNSSQLTAWSSWWRGWGDSGSTETFDFPSVVSSDYFLFLFLELVWIFWVVPCIPMICCFLSSSINRRQPFLTISYHMAAWKWQIINRYLFICYISLTSQKKCDQPSYFTIHTTCLVEREWIMQLINYSLW